MGIVNYTYNRSTSGGEIITHLINASDSAGLHFDGIAGYVSAGDTTVLDGATKVSVEVIAATSSTTEGDVFSKCRSTTALRLYFKADGKIHIRINNGLSNGDATSAGSYNDGNPKHIVATWDALKLRIYVNGNLDGEGDLVGGSFKDVADFLAIGAQVDASASASYFEGIVYRARIWNKALSSAEVTASYENATVPFADQYGSQTSLVDAAASVFTSGTYSWAASGTNTIANVSNTLAITYTGGSPSTGGAYNYLRAISDLSTDLIVGKKYRLTVDAKYAGGASGVKLRFYNGGATDSSALTTSLVTYTFEFTAQSAAGSYLWLDAMATSNVVTIDNWYVREIGCVADYDLAFANPSPSPNGQSLMVRDRASAADGTSSTAGVVQVTPIEQLNAKAARIGSAVQTPADGQAMIDSVLVTDTSDSGFDGGLSVWRSAATSKVGYINCRGGAFNINAPDAYSTKFRNNGGGELLTIDSSGQTAGTGSLNGDWVFKTTNSHASGYGALVIAGGSTSAQTAFEVRHTGNVSSGTTAFKVDCAGLATFANGIVETNGVLKSNLLTNSGFDVWSNSTLENVGSELAVDGTFSDSANWTEEAGWAVTGGKAVATSAATGKQMFQSRTFTVGKLYRAIFEISGYSAGGVHASLSGNASPSFTANGTYTFVFEAALASNYINFVTDGTTTLDIEYVTLYEVTPGIVTGAATTAGPDGWYKTATSGMWRQHNDGGTYTKDGSFYAAKVTTTVAWAGLNWPLSAVSAADEWTQRFAGRTVTFGAWLKTSTATLARLIINDSSSQTPSATHTGGGAWEWLEVTVTIGAAPTSVLFQVGDLSGTGTYYISQPTLVFGSAIGSGNYSRPMGEVVNCEGMVRIQNNVSPLAADDKILNLEALSDGKIPKGCRAVNISGQLENSAVTTYDGVLWQATSAGVYQVRAYPLVANFGATYNGLVTCDSNGDIYQLVTEPDATLSALYQDVVAVHLR